MNYFFLLSKEDIILSKEEAISLLKIKGKLKSNLLFFDSNLNGLEDRLAYTNKPYKHLFSCKTNDLIKTIKKFDWQNIYKKNFCVRTHNKKSNKYSERTLASHIWSKLKNPKVNLEKPKTSIEFFFINNNVYCGLFIKKLKHDFEKRKAHLRPALHPTSLNPKLARCIVNLTGIKKGIIADLFCGAGGILIEAGLIGLEPVGYDLYREMINRAKLNLNHYKIKNYKLYNQDALKITKKYDYIATDLPYGLNTSVWIRHKNKNKKISLNQKDKGKRIKLLEQFYLAFLKNLKKILRKKAVIILPHYVNYKKLIKKANLNVEKEFSQYIHSSLTRKILVITN